VTPVEPTAASALDGVDLDRIPIYCINLSASGGRRTSMERRFAAAGLLDRVQFVAGVDGASLPVDEYLERTGARAVNSLRRAEVGCLLSHVHVLESFLRETPDSVGSAIIFEDDVLLHRDWHQRLERVLGNMPADAPICVLGHFRVGLTDLSWVGRNPLQRNLVPMLLGTMWGTQAYWISREHAQAVLDFERQYEGDDLNAELLTWRTNGFAALPPLAVEDGSSSTIRADSDVALRQPWWSGWGIENYLSVEEDERLFEAQISRERQTICLCMIVKDESRVIDRLADSVRDFIDTWVICDTGSTDGTPERVQEAFKDIPGELFFDEWKDFGTNRTLMLERAQGRADYLLILDADHTLRLEGRLPHLTAESYALLVDEVQAHWVPRLVRGDIPWRYVGSAHEYIDSDQPHRIDVLPLLVVEHHADGGNRPGNMNLERELLEKDLEEDPNNPRTVFYLAQTYRELGLDELATQFYARRLELGGWPEEMFCAMYWHAELVGRTDWDLGVALLLEAWEYRPMRVEPLFALTQGFRLRNQFRLGALFGAKGKDLDFPSDLLFVHRDYYLWGTEYEWSICAYNTGDFKGALEACNHLLTVPDLPTDIREYVVGARRRCLLGLGEIETEEDRDAAALIKAQTPSLPNLVPGTQIGEVRLTVDPPWPQFNPSIASDWEGFKMLVRTSDSPPGDAASQEPDDQEVSSIYYEVEMAPDLSPTDVRPILHAASPPGPSGNIGTDGIEDCRLVKVGSRWFALANSREFNRGWARRLGLVDVVDGGFRHLRVLEGPDPERNEKNWMPFVRGDQLYLVYTCWPTVVFRCDLDSGRLTEVGRHDASFALNEERGGSQGVEVDDGILFVTHRVIRPDGRRLYEHRFVLMEPESMKFVAASPRFRFLEARVEFCAGMALAEDNLVLSFAVGHQRAFLARAPYEAVRASLWPL
jgi:GR25 family glycosyltransferase involved in LPS biosynthesis/glycosyltransferase involved in cell wall biosynthesis